MLATEYEVVIAGAGPTGLMLAGELALAGIKGVIVERRPNQDLDGSRAGGLHARTIEVFDQRGIAERFLSVGHKHSSLSYAQLILDISDLPTRHNYTLALWQSQIERILADWVSELGVPILRNRELLDFVQNEADVEMALSDGTALRAEYLVGCDGGRSLVRKLARIDFPGLEPSTSWLIAEVEMDQVPTFGFRRDSIGTHALNRRAEGDPIRVVLTERTHEHPDDPDMTTLRQALMDVYGTDYGLRHANWISRFTDMARQASSYRCGRVLLAGDAAHIHPPQGGQGLNTGIQDAMNLGWKLAQVIKKKSPDSLLDTYHSERHPIGSRVLHNTMAQVVLGNSDKRHQALRDTVVELLGMNEPRRYVAAMISGLDICYEVGVGHPLLGRRMPDLQVDTQEGHTRVYSLLHEALPVFLDFRNSGVVGSACMDHRVRFVDAKYSGTWELPVIGEVPAPEAVLIRPDGYVVWVEGNTQHPVHEVLNSWFGT